MKAIVKHILSDVPKETHEFYNKFIKFLQSEYPLKKDVMVLFLGERDKEHMSTGSRNKHHVLKILTKGRLNRDILRTLAHEWIHEHQHAVLNRKRGPNIGGKNENEANSGAGILIKKYEKKNPHEEGLMYDSI